MKKVDFRKRLCYSTIAILSLFAVCGNSLHATTDTGPGDVLMVNDSRQSLRESIGRTMAPDFTLAPVDDLVGSWIIDQVKIKKTVNGVSSENTHSLKLKQQFKSFTDCPKKITFTADRKVIFEYDDRDPSEGSYTVEGNQITRTMPIAVLTYEYTITDANKIQMLYLFDYERGNERITEEYTFFGTKQ